MLTDDSFTNRRNKQVLLIGDVVIDHNVTAPCSFNVCFCMWRVVEPLMTTTWQEHLDNTKY